MLYFPPAWRHHLIFSILKRAKDPALPSSYRIISLLDETNQLFKNILLTRILSEVSGRWLLRKKKFGFRTKHSSAIQVTCLDERVARNFDEKRLIGGGFPDVAIVFYNIWVDCLLEKLTAFNFTLYVAKTISSSLHGRTFEASFQTDKSICRCLQANVFRGEIISPVILGLYVMDMHLHSHHVDLAVYAGTSDQPSLILIYLESHLNDLEQLLKEWRTSINVSNSTETHFARVSGHFSIPRTVQIFGKPNHWVDITL